MYFTFDGLSAIHAFSLRALKIFLAVLLVCSTGCTDENKRSSDLLVGTWKDQAGTVVTYNPDGTAGAVAEIPGVFSNTTFVANTSWYIKDGYLYNTVTSSTDKDRVPVGYKVADKIVQLDAFSFTYISGVNGTQHTDTRVTTK